VSKELNIVPILEQFVNYFKVFPFDHAEGGCRVFKNLV
jgi:hypothetical protein